MRKRLFALFISPIVNNGTPLPWFKLSDLTARGRSCVLLLIFCLLSGTSMAQQASDILVSPVAGSTSSLKLDWTNGGEGNRMVVVRSANSIWVPSNGTTYTATTAYPVDAATGAGPDFDATGNIAAVVFNGGGTTVTVTNLAPNTFYTVQVYEYSAGPTYNFATATNNPRVVWYYTSTTGDNYTVPAGVTGITVQAWGGGGSGGGDGSTDNGRAGGGGAAYVSGTIATSGGTTYAVSIGQGGGTGNGNPTTFGGGTLFSADFGRAGADSGNTAGAAGTAGASVVTATATNPVKTSGTAGSGRNNPSGGAGGNAGNTTGTGGTGNPSANGSPGKVPGGGGAGAGLNSQGGAGGNGMVIVTHNPGPTFVRAFTSTTTQIKVKFNSTITSVAQANGSGFTITGATITAAAIDGGDATVVNLTVNTIAGSFTCTGCLSVAAAAVSNSSGSNAAITTQNVTDGIAPAAPGTPTSPVAGATINDAEEAAGVVIRVPFGTSGAVSGDVVRLLFGGSNFSSPITGAINGTDITNGYKELTIATGQLGSDGAGKLISARIEDAAGNTGAASADLSLTLDTQGPTSTASYTKSLISNGTNQTITIVFNEAVTGTPTISVDGSVTGSLFSDEALTNSGDDLTWTFDAEDVWANDGEIFTVTIGGTGTDAAGNNADENPASNTFTVDNDAPDAPSIVSLTTNAGGTVVPGYYNISNAANTAGIMIGVAVPADPSVEGGTIQLEVANQDVVVAYIPLGSPVAVPTSGVTQNINISHATLAGNGEYGDGKILSFRAVITDNAGNSSTAGSTFGSTLTVDLTAPTNQDDVYTASTFVTPGTSVGLTAGTATDANWLAPSGTTTFVANVTTITTTAGDATSITAPTDAGTYKLFIVDPAGNPSTQSSATLTVVAPPSTNSTIGFNSVTDVSMTVTLTGGNGARRLVIARLGSAPDVDPANFTSYTASANWNNGTPSGTAVGSGFVVYDGTGTSFNFTNLQAGTYHFAAYDYNGTSTSTGAFNLTQTTGSRATVVQASNITFGTPGATSIALNWTAGTGTNRIVIARTAGAVFSPVNGTTYTSSPNFTTAPDLNGATAGTVRCVYNSAPPDNDSGNTVTVTNLTANNASYDFQVYEYTGAPGSEVYVLTTATGNPANRHTMVSAAPTTSATEVTFSAITNNSITFEVTQPGNGANRIILVSDAVITLDPVDGASYTANTDFTAGTDLDATAVVTKVVGFGSGPHTVTNLSGDKIYYFSVFEFDGTQGTGAENYRGTEYQVTRNTEPTTQSHTLNFSAISASGMTLSWTSGNGDRRLVLAHAGAAVDATPSDLTSYAASQDWGVKGTEVGTGNFVVYDGTGTSTGAITNLQANTTYHFAIFEYNSHTGVQPGAAAGPSAAAFLTPTTATASQATSVDGTPPADFEVETVTAKDGREVAAYWNLTNTTLEVVVPIDDADPTLDLGTVQLQLRQSSPASGTFTNIQGLLDAVGSGFSTITHAERVAGTKTITVSKTNLVADAEFAEGAIFQITAIITDYSGNTKTGTQSDVNTVIDQTPPAVVSNAYRLYKDAVSGRDVIQFVVTEALTNHATPPVERGDQFPFINGNNPYGNPGISVGGGTTAGVTDDVRYFNAGTTNALDGSLTNTHLIYVESANGGATWDVANATRIQYVPGGNSETSNYVMRDAAGNELSAFNVLVSAGATTTLGAATATAGPNLNSSTIDRAVFAFSLNSTANVNITALSIIASVNPNGLLNTFRLYSSSTDNFAAATEVTPNPVATVVTTPPYAVNFNSISIPLTGGSTKYFYLVANVDSYFLSTDPTIQFSMAASPLPNAAGGFTASSGGYAGSTQTGTTYTLKDVTAPTVLQINTEPVIYLGNLGQTVSIVFSEPMKTSTAAAAGTLDVSFTGVDNWGAFIAGGWSTTNLTNDTYTVTFTHDGDPQTSLENITATNTTTLTDWGNNQHAAAASSNFTVDTQRPTVTSATISGSTLINQSNDEVTLEVVFNEKMNTSGGSNNPTVMIVPSNGNLTPGTFVWDTSNPAFDKLTVVYTHDLDEEEIASTYFTINGALDANGNQQTASANSSTFQIDTEFPTVVSVTRSNPTSQFTNSATVFYNVQFSEPVGNVTISDFTPFVVLNNPSVYPGDVVDVSTTDNINFAVEVKNIAGDGNIRLDVNTSGAIQDDYGNILNTGFTGGQIYTVDNTPAVAESIVISSPTHTWSTVNAIPIYLNDSASFVVEFSEPVTGVDASDFTITNASTANLSIGGPVEITGSGTIWTVKLKGLNLITATGGGAQFKINLIDNNTILDQAGLPLGGPSMGDGNLITSTLPPPDPSALDYYTAVYPEPEDIGSNYLVTGTTNTSFSFRFNSPATPTERIQYFVVQLKIDTVSSFLDPADGVYPAGVNDSDLSDGRVGVLISNPSNGALINFNTTSIGTLASGFNYDVRIISVSYSGLYNSQQHLDYFTTSTLNGAGNTTTGSAGTVSSTSTAATISSLITAGNGVPVYTFTLNEDGTGATKGVDNAPTKFNTLIIKQGGTNNVSNWTTTIAGAELTDLEGNVITGVDVDINATDITFTNIPSSDNTEMGFLDDNEDKQFTLRIWLFDPLVVADNSRLDFRIDNSSFPLFDDASGSQISSKLATTSAESGTVRINVYAVKLVFVTNPQPNIGVGINFNQSTQAQPRIEARDENDNLDLDYNAAFTVTPSTGVSTSLTNFSAGVLTLSTFNFTTSGSRTITIRGNAVTTPIAYPALTGLGIEATSSSVNAVISNRTRIFNATAPSAERDFIPSTTNATPSFFNFDFTIKDDVGVDLVDHTDDDALPTIVQTITINRGGNNGVNATPGPNTDAATFDDWTKSIAGAQLKAVGNSQTVSGTVNNGSLVFAIPAGSFMETIPNNDSLRYELRIWLQNPVDATLRDIIDNKDFSFTINQNDIGIGSANSTSTLATSNAFTANGRNVVTVTASQLDFVTQWTDFADQNYDAALSPTPAAKARDANQNLDTDYNTAASVSAFDSNTMDTKTYPLVNSAVNVSNGLISFNSGLQVSSTGNGVHNDESRLVLTSGSLTQGESNWFTLIYSGDSDIIRDASFTHPTDIQTINFREATNLTDVNSVPLDRFLLRDGGTSDDDDGTKTKLQSISLNLTNYQNIRRIGLYDENGVEIQELDSTAFNSSGNITFASFANVFEAEDDDRTTKLLTVRVSFRAFVTDNQQINVSVTAATAAGVSSQLIPVTIPGDNLSTDKNKVEVVATRIDFTTAPATASISVPLSPQVVVSARDRFANLDLDYNGTITAVETDPDDDLLFHTLNNPAGSFSGGQFTYPSDFQFDVGNGIVKLTIDAGPGIGLNNINAGAISGISDEINVLSSFESGLYSSWTANDMDYANFQAGNITTMSEGYILDYLYLTDGSQDGSAGDDDGASTTLEDLTLGISNPQSIRRIAIYRYDSNIDDWVEVQEQANIDITVTGTNFGQVEFDNLNIVAEDDDYAYILVLATFNSGPAAIQDNDSIQVSVLDATAGTGSKFYPDGSNTTTIGGVAKTFLTFPPSATAIEAGSKGPYNKIEVIASSLDFVTQPNDFAGINQPIDATTASAPPYSGVVHARDKFAVLDTDFNFAASVTASANPYSYPANFSNGELDLTSMRYNNAGDGTLTVQANSLNSNNEPWTTSAAGDQVDVINVTAAENTNGVLTTPNLKGGNVNQTIFGFTFNPQHYTSGEPSLKGFSITFKDDNGNPYFFKTAGSTILKGFKILESTQGTAAGATNIAGIATISQVRSPRAASLGAPATSFDMVTVTFNPGNYRSLHDPANPLTYYLQVDVDVSTNIGTPPVTPYLEDNGYADVFTRDNVILTEGSSQITPFVKGATRSFASTKPPAIVSSNPFNGQLNVDPEQDTITIFFDVPVTSFDGIAFLYDRYSNTLVDTLHAANGIYQWSTGQATSPSPYVTNPIKFALPDGLDLIPDSVYYVTINQGRFDPNNPNDRAGISDDGFNLFGGISFNGTLYFKAASPNPPVMKGTDALKYYFSQTTATINASFNQRGTAYFMITSTGAATPPDTAQIKGALYTNRTVYGRGKIDIKQIEPSFQYGTINASLTPGTTYDVFMFAENDALPDPIGTAAPYGSLANSFVAGTAGPTLRFTVPSSASTTLTNFPRYQICSNSYTLLSDPIIISEVSDQQFTGTGIQTINILLPTGFQFDVTKAPSVQFNGSDFNNSILGTTPKFEFINTTILKISFGNNGVNDNLDNIIISDLVVISNAPDITGYITRFSGNGIPSITDGTQFAQITSAADDPINFTNSYSEVGNFDQVPVSIANTVTYIPDNYVDTTLNQSATRLFPIAPKGDYGPTSFSGAGLTNDILNLTAVPLNTGFNISLTHTDMNGCISSKSEQYTVYNHKNAISALGAASPTTGERQVCIRNYNFPGDANTTSNPIVITDSVSTDGLAGYKLIELFANIPTKAKPKPGVETQIMEYGSAWQTLVEDIPVPYSAKFDANTGQTYRTYNWDYKSILNANTLSGGTLDNPYDFFVQPNTPLGKTYYKGGSLGIIEFTGKYHSKADFSVFIPVRQEIEVFVPAIPVVEQVTPPSSVEAGTLIYCEGMGSASDILINGYPAASPGSSKGEFFLRDSATMVLLTIPSGGFVDNGNGTSTLKSNVTNNYRTIRVEYTYKDNNSPCNATGFFYIRITPNPIASFSATSVLTSANPIDMGRPSAPNSYCEDNLIQFDNTSTFPAGPETYIANTNPHWTLGDPLSGNNVQEKDSALFVYNTSGRYDVSFSVRSQYGCPSEVVTNPIYIGVIPTPSFKMNGISTATRLNVRSTTTISSGASYPLSDTLQSLWHFGDPAVADPNNMTFSTANKHNYLTPGHYVVTLKATTSITGFAGDTPKPGCEISYQKPVIIVPHGGTITVETIEDFSSNAAGVQWQTSSTDPLLSSWERGVPAKPSTADFVATDPANSVWATNLDGDYNAGEVSFLYSPSYNLSSLVRPKIGFDQVAFMGGNDGVAVEFSVDTFNIADPNKKWFRIGSNSNGNNWYNKSGLASSPGDQTDYGSGLTSGDYGWSSQLDTVLHSQHTLTPDLPEGRRNNVIFRFALASLAGSSEEGFAVDNFRVGERTRIVLIENFTNLGNTLAINGANVELRESDSLRSYFPTVGTDVIKLNYHVSFPNLDPFNDDYPASPSARALYYNINETPLARMDGSKPADPQKKYFSTWGMESFNIRTLVLAQAELEIIDLETLPAGGFRFNVRVTAKADLEENVTILHAAFVEASTPLASLSASDQEMIKTGDTSFDYVVKAMMPNALGTKFQTELLTGNSREFGPFEWAPDLSKLYGDNDDLAIVVFLQNEVTHEVYQAAISTPLTDPSVVTGTEDPDYAGKVSLYPNPANTEVHIQLPTAVSKATPVFMIDTYGRTIVEDRFEVGEQVKTIKTTDMTSGVYFIQFATPDGILVRKKVMVIHR